MNDSGKASRFWELGSIRISLLVTGFVRTLILGEGGGANTVCHLKFFFKIIKCKLNKKFMFIKSCHAIGSVKLRIFCFFA